MEISSLQDIRTQSDLKYLILTSHSQLLWFLTVLTTATHFSHGTVKDISTNYDWFKIHYQEP